MSVACKTCCYWSEDRPRNEIVSYGFPAAGGESELPPPSHIVKGQCRRFPPFMARTEKGMRAQWPITLQTHWCGEHGEIVANRQAGE